ncbi:uncharacterized protein LOC129791225 [Lutzomyia longipalpis]|uniref:uncharacterized protein LOC129791225 n=1 Tax=Lutzomyia longipalpis TaxID=7200 RepID=UPI002483E7B7|nr:uncharacterized protein LOC129791225 [Lutzomyia longipalpis]
MCEIMAENKRNQKYESSDIFISKLLNALENDDVLWNIRNPLYSNRDVRPKKMQKLAQSLQTSPTVIKNKIKYLKAKYAEEKAFIYGKKSGSAGGEPEKVKWKWFESCKFFDPGICINKSAVQSTFPRKRSQNERQSDEAPDFPEKKKKKVSISKNAVKNNILEKFLTQNFKNRDVQYLEEDEDEVIPYLFSQSQNISSPKESFSAMEFQGVYSGINTPPQNAQNDVASPRSALSERSKSPQNTQDSDEIFGGTLSGRWKRPVHDPRTQESPEGTLSGRWKRPVHDPRTQESPEGTLSGRWKRPVHDPRTQESPEGTLSGRWKRPVHDPRTQESPEGTFSGRWKRPVHDPRTQESPEGTLSGRWKRPVHDPRTQERERLSLIESLASILKIHLTASNMTSDDLITFHSDLITFIKSYKN